jgi:NTE family protein
MTNRLYSKNLLEGKVDKMASKRIELALQGGGAHGAMTWGILDRLLEDDGIEITAISGTSAGAMNAAVLADGLDRGGPAGARQALEEFWRAVSQAAAFSPIQRGLWSRLLGDWSLDRSAGYLFFDQLSRVLSPYQLNPLNINPLRDLVARTIDFDRVNRCGSVKLFVTATNVRTGRPRVFRQGELSADALMASAALPFLFHAVEIDGEAYWDGGYVGNPSLYPLVDECPCRDLVLVQINPFLRDEVPHSAREIINRVNEITFNNSLLKELHAIQLLDEGLRAGGATDQRFRQMRLHRIHAGEDLQTLSASSKLNAEWRYLSRLRDLGRAHAERWLDAHRADIGQRSTFDPSTLMGEHLMTADECRPAD